ncbi:glucose transporter rco-3 [Pestalotiopsis fici W106-1]|uniref:Glucose transporter rco-3 n=1 Tax=Pestalotiopsis fici (strain W106-1 / CGMCC3.15140) TaxID=1229662 RepID=W3X4A5_PESFW|nr:glucose transporter rco-3 [Pestalotiopsis fici W106-1]ETS80973.1 glucose transporter rco-3 [Pestalotiopsis fici W106-1]
MAIAMGWHKPKNVAGSSAPAIMVGLFVASGGLLFGYDTGAINGILAMDAFLKQFTTGFVDDSGSPAFIPAQTAIIVAILSAGTALGALLGAPSADYIGRRWSLLVSVGVFCFGVIFQVCADAIPMLLVGRFFAGVGVGAVSLLVPLYQSEMAPKWIRGTLVCAYQLSITLGLLIASAVNIAVKDMTGAAAYRIPIGLQFAPACVLALGIVLLPETPRYLIKKGRKDDAALSLSRLRRLDITHPALVDELHEIEANHQYELSLGPPSWNDFLIGAPHLGRRTLTGCALQMLQQLSGINFIMYYGTTFFHGAKVDSPFLISIITNVINVFSTLPGLFVVESWGRRKLLMTGAAGMSICQLVIAITASVVNNAETRAYSTVLIVFVCLFIFFYAASWGPVCWVVTAEIYPLKIRAKAMSFSTASNWLLNFGIAYGTPFMYSTGAGAADMGSKVFYVWGAFCILSWIFVYCMVYETSKISLEQIDEMYERVDHAWNSHKFEPSWSFQQLRDEGFADSGIPPAHHELQPSVTGSSATDSIETIHTDPGTGDNRTEEDKMIQQMGLSNVEFSY